MTQQFFTAFAVRAFTALGSVLFIYAASMVGGASLAGGVAIAHALVFFLGIISSFGMNASLMRDAGCNRACEQNLVRALLFSGILSALIAVIVFLLKDEISSLLSSSHLVLLLPGFMASAPAFALSYILSGYLKGRGRPVEGVVQENGMISGVAGISIFVIAQVYDLSAMWLAWIYFLSSLLVLCLGAYSVMKALPGKKLKGGRNRFPSFLFSSTPFFVTNISDFIHANAFVLIVAYHMGEEDVGVFRVAERLAVLVSFPLVVVNSLYARHFSLLYHSDRLKDLSRKYRDSIFLGLLIGGPTFLVLMSFSAEALAFFGKEFSGYTAILKILLVGHIVNVLAGSVALLMNMSGEERYVRNVTAWMGLVGIAVVWGTAQYGLIYAALTLAGLLVIKNIAMLLGVAKKFGRSFILSNESLGENSK